ncbi:HPP family protein [Vibrio aphrogenes]|uniref:HPP family protein n=1 Tax=Vibrio aphrogenes TaxID=1891186 RepID=UPI000B34AC96|nr:HPP family protein [Vibrio aphrogenes]
MKRFILPIISGLGATLAIGLLALLNGTLKDIVLLMAPFGATAVLVFGIPDSPLAQPKNVIFGHLITAMIGIIFVQYIGITPLDLGLATGLGVTAMLVTNTTHPPAGANPLLIMLSGQNWEFLISPVLIGALVIVALGKTMLRFQHQIISNKKPN